MTNLHRRVTDQPADPSSLKERALSLFTNVSRGNMGPALYTNGGSNKYSDILSTNDQYMPFQGEVALIDKHKESIAKWAKDVDTVIIIGPGPTQAIASKEVPILRLLPNLKTVQLIDLSEQFNIEARDVITTVLPDLKVEYYTGDFRNVTTNQNYSRALVMTTGSLTNFEDAPVDNFPSATASGYLNRFQELAKSGGKILWGYDANADKDSLIEEYDTPEIAAFILNPLVKLQNTPGVQIDPSKFEYKPEFLPRGSHLAHNWEVTEDQTIKIDGQAIEVFQGDRFLCFSSIKLNPSRLTILARAKGLQQHKSYTHDQDKQVLHCFDCK